MKAMNENEAERGAGCGITESIAAGSARNRSDKPTRPRIERTHILGPGRHEPDARDVAKTMISNPVPARFDDEAYGNASRRRRFAIDEAVPAQGLGGFCCAEQIGAKRRARSGLGCSRSTSNEECVSFR